MTYNPLIGNADLRDSTGLSVIGRSANSIGDPADIVADTDGYVLQRSGSTLIFGPAPAGPGGSGDVVGPSSAADNAVARFDATTGKLLQNSAVLITDAGALGSADGTAALPAYSFTSDPNTGIYNVGEDQIGISAGGTVRLTTSTTAHTSTLPVRNQSGTAAAPAYSFAGDIFTGFFSPAAEQLGFSANGTLRATLTTTSLTMAVPILASAGTDAAPSLSFADNPNTGFYSGAPGGNVMIISSDSKYVGNITASGPTGQINLFGSTPTGSGLFGVGLGDYDRRGYFAAEQGAIKIQSEYDGYDVVLQSTSAGFVKLKTGTTTRLTTSATAITTTVPVLAPAGDAITPSLSFSGDENTGMFQLSADILGFSAGGTGLLYIGGGVAQGYATSSFQLYSGTPSASNPAYSFVSDADTGIYRAAANTIAVSCGGISRTSQAGTLTTTDDTATTIITISTETDKAYSVGLQVVMRKTSTGDVNSYFTNIRIKNVAGTVSGTVLANSHGTDVGLTAITLAISGTNALLQVTGNAATTCEWKAFVDVISV